MGLPDEHIWLQSKIRLKINHWRLSPEPPELAGFYVDSVGSGSEAARTTWKRGDTFSEIKRALLTVVSDRWQPGRSRDLGIGIGLHFELELHVGLVVLLVLVPVILGGELIVRVGLISSHSQTSRERAYSFLPSRRKP